MRRQEDERNQKFWTEPRIKIALAIAVGAVALTLLYFALKYTFVLLEGLKEEIKQSATETATEDDTDLTRQFVFLTSIILALLLIWHKVR